MVYCRLIPAWPPGLNTIGERDPSNAANYASAYMNRHHMARRSPLNAASALKWGPLLTLGTLLCLCAGQTAWACGCDLPAASQPADSQPAASQPAPPPATAEGWLDLIEQETARIKTLQAEVRYDRVQELQGDEQRRFGTLVFSTGPPAKFAVHFSAMFADELPHPLDKWYIFDGQWLIERDDRDRKFSRTQIVPPDAAPQQANPLALGQGPFALPIGAKRELIQRRFTVKLIAAAEGDPADTVHLRLTARPDRDIEYDRIDLWYHRKTLVPIRAATRQLGSDDQHIFHLLGKVRLNEKIEGNLIDTAVPDKGRGWHVESTPWQQPTPPARQ